MNLDVESLSEILGFPVEEIHIDIAKYEVQGFGAADIAEVFAADEAEILEIMAKSQYQDTKRLIAMQLAKTAADTDISWDSIEHAALQKLRKHVELAIDPEFTLKVAALANKAQRRHRAQNEALNPAAAGARVSLTLSQRFVDKIQGTKETQILERRIDIEKAAEYRVSVNEIKGFLQPTITEKSIKEKLGEALDSLMPTGGSTLVA